MLIDEANRLKSRFTSSTSEQLDQGELHGEVIQMRAD